jgi:hypothetical protein
MARRQAAQPQITRRYYVYDAGVQRYLGGYPVKQDERGQRYVMLTAEQANYWMQTGAIGTVILDQVTGEARRQIHQLSGGRIPMTEEDFARGRSREHQVMSMGAYGLPGKKLKVSTERNAVQDPATHIDNVIKHGGLGTDASISGEARRHARRNNTEVMFSVSEGMSKTELARIPGAKG